MPMRRRRHVVAERDLPPPGEPQALPDGPVAGASGPTSPRRADQVDRELDRLLDGERRDRAAADRRAAELRRFVEQDSANLLGVLRDLAENQVGVVLEHAGGRVSGTIVALGADCVVLAERRGRGHAAVPLGQVQLVEVAAWHVARTDRGHVAHPSDLGLREVLAAAVEDRRDVRLHVRGRDEPVSGRLRAVGADVLTVVDRVAGGRTTCVALAHLVRADLE